MRRSCRAGAATASRCGCSSSWSRTTTWCRCSRITAAASSSSRARRARGFVVPEDDCVANTRKGKQVLNVKRRREGAPPSTPVEGELVASIGENRKMVIFPIEQVPEMTRGAGVRLQRYKDGALSDITTFKAGDGLTWIDSAGRSFTMSMKELSDWRGNRADAGRLAPKGFPKNNHFGRLPEGRAETEAGRRSRCALLAFCGATAVALLGRSFGAGGVPQGQRAGSGRRRTADIRPHLHPGLQAETAGLHPAAMRRTRALKAAANSTRSSAPSGFMCSRWTMPCGSGCGRSRASRFA